jgi:chorismate dehydratase
MKPLTIGHITYANCAPFFYYLAESGFVGKIVDGVPAELNRLLATGQLDVCPSSSIEYAQNASDYLLLPEHSISSIGPVQSVLLFTDIPMAGLSGVPITITGESATSVALLQVLLREFFQIADVEFVKEEIHPGDFKEQSLPMLLIGDRALKARKLMAESCMVIDLGELWYHYTGLPFVFALWIVNRQAAVNKRAEIELFADQLMQSRTKALSTYPEMAAMVAEKEWMGEQGLIDYWRQVSYDLDPFHLEGLRCFYFLLEKNGLIEKAPEIEFFE